MAETPPAFPSSLPLVGRAAELEELHALLDRAESGRAGTLILCGQSGVGKTRLLRTCAEEAERRDWQVAFGRAYPVESGIPYAPFADALLPLLRALPESALTSLTRGGEAELGYLFPALRVEGTTRARPGDDPAELKTRLLWNLVQFLGRLSARSPLLLILEDLQWADASSLELLHFVARQIGSEPIALLASYNEGQRDLNPLLRTTEQSLVGLGAARVHRVGPLTAESTAAAIRDAFGADQAAIRGFAAQLYGWTRGNPFFLEETLKSLVQAGRLYQRDGRWYGWDLETLELPRSIRDALVVRLAALSPGARAVADLMAVIGTSASFDELRAVAGTSEAELVSSTDELRSREILEERLYEGTVTYDLTHPLLRETLYGEIGLARAKLLHARVATELEAYYGSSAIAHADRLAYHYAKVRTRDLAPKAIRYLATAGREALAKYADREAADYLGAAVEHAADVEGAEAVDPQLPHDLARARQRLGDFDAAIEIWERARGEGAGAESASRVAAVERRLGLAYYWSRRYEKALEHFERGLEAARSAGERELEARLRLSAGECLMEVGRPEDARGELTTALGIAEGLGAADLESRVHLALLLLHTWTGPPSTARQHGESALALADRMRDPGLSCTVHWGLAVLSGLTGDAVATRRHIAAGEQLADLIGSPLHRLRIAEPAIEFMSNTGEWEAGLVLAERTVATARALNQQGILARLLVWTSLIYLGRGDLERGRRYVDEAWEISGAGDPDRPLDVHTVVPAHAGRAAYHVAVGEFEAAIEVGGAGLEIADRTGYTVWAIHRLLPILAEAHLSAGNVEGATSVGARLRSESEALGHQLGLAWADACDAFLIWLRGDIAAGVVRLRAAAERLESIPVIPDAARLRRHFAARLRDHGAPGEAIAELRHVHEIFSRLGAERELAKTREQIRELGARPPAREAAAGAAGLSSREAEIARLVAARKSNKMIGRELGISPRTVSTHLSNIFRKLEVGSRAELTDLMRRLDLPDS